MTALFMFSWLIAFKLLFKTLFHGRHHIIDKFTRQFRVVLLGLEVVNPVGPYSPIRPQQLLEARVAQINFNVLPIVFDGGVSAVMLNAGEFLKPGFIMLFLTAALVASDRVGERNQFDVLDFHTAKGV